MAGWVDVAWDKGGSNSYRMGAESKYDLTLATPSEAMSSSSYSTKSDGTQSPEVTTPPVSRRFQVLNRSNKLASNRHNVSLDCYYNVYLLDSNCVLDMKLERNNYKYNRFSLGWC